MGLKDTKIIDLNLISGSSELIRRSMGGKYYNSETSNLEFNVVDTSKAVQIEKTEFSELQLRFDKILPMHKYSVRVFSDDSNDQILSDFDWKTFVVGGTFGEKQYDGIYNDFAYSDHYNNSALPLLPREVINTNIVPSLSLTTEYYNYYERFQSEVSNLESEVMAPNYYFLDIDFIRPVMDDNSTVSRARYPDLENFLTNSFINSEKTYDSKMENIFVVRENLASAQMFFRYNRRKRFVDSSGPLDSDLAYRYSLMPFGNKLQIRRNLAVTDNTYRQIIQQNNYNIKFLKTLKEVFLGESGLQPSTVNFAVNTAAEASTGTATGLFESTTTVPIKLVDVPTMLLYSYKNPNSETSNISILNEDAAYSSYQTEIDYAFDETGIYRYKNSENTLKVFNEFAKQIDKNFEGEPTVYPLNNFLEQANNPKQNETIAFRIQKIGGPPTGDYNTENTIQNIWFYNRNTAITYLDTQVKYDTEYTYKIFKYDIVQGYKYKLSDIATTRQIAVTSSGDDTVYCLEFYDPFTGLPTGNLLDSDSIGPLKEQFATSIDRVNIIQANILLLDYLFNKIQIYITTLGSTKVALAAGAAYNTTTLYTRYVADILTKYPTYYPSSGAFPTLDYIPFYRYTFTLESGGFTDLENISTQAILGLGWQAVDIAYDYGNLVPGRDAPLVNLALEQVQPEINTDKLIDYFQDLSNEYSDLRSKFSALLPDATAERDRLSDLIKFVESPDLRGNAQINSSYKYLADFNIAIEPSVKILEIPLEEKRMRIVDHPPNDFIVTPHHLLDQSNRLAFYCKYDTFSMNAVTYPATVTAQDQQNKSAYLIGHDFIDTSEQTQESVSRPRFIEVYRTTTKPTSYESFAGSLRNTIDLRQPNGDIPTDHLFVERVRENTKYYYAFRGLNENRVAGQMSPIFEAELINDGGYVYAKFEQYSEDELAAPPPKEPLLGFKKLFNIIPNIQHLQLDTSRVDFTSSSVSQLSAMGLGTDTEDTLWDNEKYYKIRLTSKKTGKKIDLNIGFEKKERK